MISTSELAPTARPAPRLVGCGFASLPARKSETTRIYIKRREQKAKKNYARDVGKSRKKKSSE
jgi:hypothetical protein